MDGRVVRYEDGLLTSLLLNDVGGLLEIVQTVLIIIVTILRNHQDRTSFSGLVWTAIELSKLVKH